MSALGHKRTSQDVRVMSALPPKADIGATTRSPRRAAAGSRSFVSCSCAGTARHGLVPVGHMAQLWAYFYLRKTTTDIDRDQRSDVGNREAIASNKFMSVQLAIHPFKALIDYRSLRLAVFWELLETALKN